MPKSSQAAGIEPAPPGGCLSDRHGRVARYLRLSITDRCNLACVYCRPLAGAPFIPHERILRYEEFLRLIRIAHNLGISKLRITGGEPFARKGCAEFLASLRENFPKLRLAVTSNGTLLQKHIPLLASLGLDSVNLSLDSFRRASFERLSGRDLLHEVLASLEGLLAAKIPLKLNAVALRGVTDLELPDYLEAVRHWPIDLRFIEFMPIGNGTRWSEAQYLSAEELRTAIARQGKLVPLERSDCEAGPARLYSLEGAVGRIGFITPLSAHFCADCNRLRLTSDGRLRHCLYADREYRLSGILRKPGLDDATIERVFRAACLAKPLGVDLLRAKAQTAVARKRMSGIGG